LTSRSTQENQSFSWGSPSQRRTMARRSGSIGLPSLLHGFRRRAEHVGAKVVPGNSGRLFNGQAVVSSDRSTPTGPLPHQGGLNVNALSKGALAACLLDRNSNWAVHATTIALLLRI